MGLRNINEIKSVYQFITEKERLLSKATNGLISESVFKQINTSIAQLEEAATTMSPKEQAEQPVFKLLQKGIIEYAYEEYKNNPTEVNKLSKDEYFKKVTEAIENCPDDAVVRTESWRKLYAIASKENLEYNRGKKVEFQQKIDKIHNTKNEYDDALREYTNEVESELQEEAKKEIGRMYGSYENMVSILDKIDKSGEIEKLKEEEVEISKKIRSLDQEYRSVDKNYKELQDAYYNTYEYAIKEGYEQNKEQFASMEEFQVKYETYLKQKNGLEKARKVEAEYWELVRQHDERSALVDEWEAKENSEQYIEYQEKLEKLKAELTKEDGEEIDYDEMPEIKALKSEYREAISAVEDAERRVDEFDAANGIDDIDKRIKDADNKILEFYEVLQENKFITEEFGTYTGDIGDEVNTDFRKKFREVKVDEIFNQINLPIFQETDARNNSHLYAEQLEEANKRKSAIKSEINTLENKSLGNQKKILKYNSVVALKVTRDRIPKYAKELNAIKKEIIVNDYNITEKELFENKIKEAAKELLAKKDLRKGIHINSKEYKKMISALEKLANWDENAGPLKDTLEELKNSASDYLIAKGRQDRKNPTALRNTRLEYGQLLIDFASEGVKDVEDMKYTIECSKELEYTKRRILASKQEVKEKNAKLEQQKTISKDVQRNAQPKQPEIQNLGIR